MNGWPARDRVLAGGVTIPASQTNAPITQEQSASANGALRCVVVVEASAISGTVDVALQTAVDTDWQTVKSTTISVTGVAGRAYIRMLAEAAADQPYLPMLNKLRVVATTGLGESITVSHVYFLLEQ